MRRKLLFRTLILLLSLLASTTPALEVLVADYDGGYTFDDPDGGGQIGSEEPLLDALADLGHAVESVDVLPTDLDDYDVVFVLLGTFPNSQPLGYDELQALEDFASWKGLYLEGGDVGFDYHSTALWSLLGADYLHDGNRYTDGNVEAVDGVPGTLSAGLTFDCPGYQTNYTDNYLDELTNDGGTVVLTGRPMGNISNARAVARSAGGRSVVSSVLFASLADGDSTKVDYLEALLGFLAETMSVEERSWGAIKVESQ